MLLILCRILSPLPKKHLRLVISSPLTEFVLELSSGSMILLIITLELGMYLQTIWRRVVGNVLINISLSNIFLTMLFAKSRVLARI